MPVNMAFLGQSIGYKHNVVKQTCLFSARRRTALCAGRSYRANVATDPGATPIQRGLRTLSHLALWPALYVGASVVCFEQIADRHTSIFLNAEVLLVVCCTGAGVYLVDRVKLRDAWLDPADAAAHPSRFAFLAAHTRFVRTLAGMLLLAAAATAARIHPWMSVLPALGVAGVLIYAAKPREQRARPKDVLLLKNAYVAAGMAGFALVVVLAAGSDPWLTTARSIGWPTGVFAAAHVFARVLADAALCDLDDEAADRSHGTSTLATTLGRTNAWNAAMLLRLGIALVLVLTPLGPFPARACWAGVTVVSSVSLRVLAPAQVRDWVDARFAVEAAVVSFLLSAW